MALKAAIAGGGTGGHIYPALSVSAELARRGAQVTWIGTADGLESRLVPREGLPFEPVHAVPLRRGSVLAVPLMLCGLLRGVRQVRRIYAGLRPEIVIGTGGFVSAPAVLAAFTLRIPVLLIEQNLLPGLANRWLSRWADGIAVAFDKSLPLLPGRRATVTGNPVRREILGCREVDRGEARLSLGLDPGRTTVLIFGGSRGARSINRAVVEAADRLSGRDDMQLLHLTGQDEYERIASASPRTGRLIYRVLPYLDDMERAYAASDLAVCRSGATTVAELAACGLPSILVPYPYAAENHQEYNARLLQDAGGAVMVRDDDLGGERLAGLVQELSGDAERLSEMSRAVKALARDDAAVRIADLAERIAVRFAE